MNDKSQKEKKEKWADDFLGSSAAGYSTNDKILDKYAKYGPTWAEKIPTWAEKILNLNGPRAENRQWGDICPNASGDEWNSLLSATLR
jgi:hypothetical protein